MNTFFQLFIFFLLPNIMLAQIEANNWAYQLQDINISEIIENNTFDLIVIDYSIDGTDENKFLSEDILQIKNSGKKVIAYISIGEAENYRSYWVNNWDADNNGIPDNTAPAWLGIENPDWKGNYKVRFWEDEWQSIIFNYIDTIISQNFDGIYCDIVDGYYFWSEVENEKNDADTLMIQFLSNIRDFVDSKTQNHFYIIPQNGEFIINESNVTSRLKQKYFNSIDAIGIEDVFFFGDFDEDNSYNPDYDRLDVLSEFLQNGKNVFSIEYLTNSTLIETYITKAKEKEFSPYVSVRSLDILNNGIVLSAYNYSNNLPSSFSLAQNFPNPFNPSTTIKFSVPPISIGETSNTKLVIFNILGQKIKTLINKKLNSGKYELIFDATNLPSGLYIYRIENRNFIESRSMLLIK